MKFRAPATLAVALATLAAFASQALAGNGNGAVLWPVEEGGNGHYYQLFANQLANAAAREAAAEAEPPSGYSSGYLMTITSSEEQAFIAEHFPPLLTCAPFNGPCIWLGASDEETEGTFRWTGGPEEGDVFWPSGGYSNWSVNEPNDFGDGEDCVIYGWSQTSQWNDVGCEGTNLSIVEWDPFRPCADPVAIRVDPEDDGGLPHGNAVAASDSLFILRAAVSDSECPLCTCDIDNSGKTTATDALLTLRRAVGQQVSLNCPEC